MERSNFIKFNYNPWKVRTGDCAIRAIVGATGLDYRIVCKRLGVSWKNGKGLIRDTGIDLEKVKQTFGSYFDIIEDFTENLNFVPDEFKDSPENDMMNDFDIENGIDGVSSGMTLNEFVNDYQNQGSFIVSCEGNPNAKSPACRKGGHLVYVRCLPNYKQGFIDIWDSGEMLVDAYMRVIKREPMSSPLHWKYDKEKHEFII